MPNHDFVVKDLFNDWGNLGVAGRVLQVVWLDSSDPFSVISDLGPGLDKRVEDNVAVKVDNGNASEAFSLLGLNAFTVECKDLSLFSAFTPLIEHRVEQHLHRTVACVNRQTLNQVLLSEGNCVLGAHTLLLWQLLATQGLT